MSLCLKLCSKWSGKCVGSDMYGNSYYESRKSDAQGNRKRWVVYKGIAEATKVPPLWHQWLHYATNQVPPKEPTNYPWQKKHQPNLTGTRLAYYPLGHVLRGGKRQKTTGDYQPWDPAS